MAVTDYRGPPPSLRTKPWPFIEKCRHAAPTARRRTDAVRRRPEIARARRRCTWPAVAGWRRIGRRRHAL